MKYLMALDQGTTSSRCVMFDGAGNVVGIAQKEHTQIFPQPSWVEHDPQEILSAQLSVATEAMVKIGATAADVAAMGITNQRETTIVWDRHTGRPVHNAIVWQCRRTAEYCDSLKASGYDRQITAKTGLVVDAYFSATKLRWILENVPGAREKAKNGDLLFGTVDTWLIWHLTGGRVHATDYTNAARTMLFNIHTLQWDADILREFNIPAAMLPQVLPSSHVYGTTDFFGAEISIAGVAGDQHAALFGQCCFSPGMVKNTYGTGCFILMNTGEMPVESKHGLLTTIAWGASGRVEYALEGSVFVAGAAVQWLRDGLRIIENASATEKMATSVEDSAGVYVVPAFVGLGAPYWDQHARGIIVGLTRGVEQEHLVRATLESLAYQSHDVIKAMEADCGDVRGIRVDGGAAGNDFLMQFQADILGAEVTRPMVTESTALGVSYLAGLGVGFFASQEEILANAQIDRTFAPQMDDVKRAELLRGWHEAVKRSMGWAK